MNYFINGLTWRNVPKFPVEMTDFSDYSTCLTLFEEALKQNPNAMIAVSIVIEEEDPDDDQNLVIRYHYEDGKIGVLLIDQEGDFCINEGYHLYLKPDRKITGSSVTGLDSEEDLDEIVKIILDYGAYAALGVQWAIFLMKERNDGALTKYFDDLYTQEIH